MAQSLLSFFAAMALDHSLLARFYLNREETMRIAGVSEVDREAVRSAQPQAIFDRLLTDIPDVASMHAPHICPFLMDFFPTTTARASDPPRAPLSTRAPLSARAPLSSRASDPGPSSVRGPRSTRSPDSVRGPVSSRSPDTGPASVRAPTSVRSPDSRQFS
jgi:hypothetical protein